MMRIAHVLAPAAFGGLESVVAGLARAQHARGHFVLVLALLDLGEESPPWLGELGRDGVRIETSRVPRRAYGRERKQALQLLARHGIEIVHTHGFRPDVVVGAAARRAGRVTCSTVHGFVRRGVRGHLYSWIQERALRGFDRVIAVSRALEAELTATGIPAASMRCIANGAAPEGTPLSRDEARRSLGLPATGIVLGWVGRVSFEKGPDLLIDAFARLADATTLLCVIGDGSERESTRALAARAGVAERVVFAGARRGASLLLAAFDVVVLSSRTEGTPMIVLEAGAAGVPIVATPVGGVPDALGEDGGWLAESTDPGAIARAIDDALAQPAERARRAGVLQRRLLARERDENWVDRYDALYAEALEASTAGTATAGMGA